jgi:integrase
MALFKRGKTWWMHAVINDYRYRESLNTTDGRLAPSLERDRIAELRNKAPDLSKQRKTFGSLTIEEAVERYVIERGSQVSTRMVGYWREQSRPLIRSKSFHDLRLSKITIAHISAYQSERLAVGKAPKTINGELSVLRQFLKHARLWYRFQEDYKPIPNNRPSVGQALTKEQIEKLFEVARTRSDWRFAFTAATLSFFCGMRACEIRALQWKDIDFENRLIDIRRSKTPAGWRTPSLNDTCHGALKELEGLASQLDLARPEHFVFPWHGREQRLDPTRPITSWRTAWRSIRIAAGLPNLRFHDGRHTAITTMAEKGVSDWVIQAQVGHVDPQMMKTYSHIRRRALIEAAEALEPKQHQEPIASVESNVEAPLIG